MMDVRPKKKKVNHTEYWIHTDDIFDNLYTPFAYDFGPPSIAQMYRFGKVVDKLLINEDNEVHFYCMSCDPRNSANAVMLMASYCILKMKWSAETTEECFSALSSYLELYRDASEGNCSYRIGVEVCFKALEKAMKLGWINFETFDYEEYTFYEQVENGDFNWIIPDKFIAMCSPTAIPKRTETSVTHTPAYYVPYFKLHNVTTIIRLNTVEYDAQLFVKQGIKHYDMYFVDGTVPPISIVDQFLEVAENTPGAIAVHCKQGLGRTGTLIACYIMKHYNFDADECIAFLRIQRPGSVVGPQQFFLEKIYTLLASTKLPKTHNLGSPKCSDQVITPLKKTHLKTPVKICA
jgi:cell division cycle 14